MLLFARCNPKSYFNFIFGICILIRNFGVHCIIVNTKFGPVLGSVFKANPTSIYAFKNIPYAKQPVGDLRFQLPRESETWDNENDLNVQKRIYCPQVSSPYVQSSNHSILGQEDCLHLDIYVPKIEIEEALPVLIYFHPGRFSYGSKEEYGSEFLLKFNEMIIAIPNYRLGILGFLSNNNSSLPGNLGLWDQRMAMKWVYENIKSFGGDAQRITIAGHDAGGASVGFHILSPLSHNYFTAAISGSGTALDPWAMSNFPENIITVADTLQCSTNSSDNMINCLRKSNVNDILAAQMTLPKIMFRPTIDKESENPFLPFPPPALYAKGYQKDVSYIAGVIREEAFAEVSDEFPTAIKTQHLDKIVQYLLSPYLQDMYNFPLIIKAAKYHYLRGVPVPTFESIKPQMVEMMSDFLYNSPLQTTLKLHSIKTQNVFMYVLNYKEEYKDLDVIHGSEYIKKHSEDLHIGDAKYVFNTTFFNGRLVHNNPKLDHMKEMLCKIWGNFSKLRSPPLLHWKKFSEKEKNYIEIAATIGAKVNYRKDDIELWTLLVPDIQNLPISSTEKTNLEEYDDPNSLSWGAAGLAILLGVLCIALVGVVVVTRRKLTQASIIPITSRKEEVQYSSVG